MDPYHAYLKTIVRDAAHHDGRGVESNSDVPQKVKEYAHLLRGAFELPAWVKEELQSSSRTTCRPQARGDGEKSRDASLRHIFNAVLNDCASIRNVLCADEEIGTCSPKESFLCILVRNALCITRRDLVVDEEALVALPRHWCGELSPLFRYMSTCVCAPLLVSIAAGVPLTSPTVDPQDEGCDGETVETGSGNSGHGDVQESSNGCSPHDDSDAVNSEVIRVQQRPGALPVYIVPHRSLSVSEWLRLPAVERVDYEDTDEDEADIDQQSIA
ncbi:hypothetical protein POSPLADRAFT_1108409, partial [Postia placenta MAD-698-R-SB12]